MKRLLLVLLVLSAAHYVAAQDNKPYVEVRGMAKFSREVKSYTLEIVLSGESYSGESSSLEYTRKVFFEKAKAGGYDATRFKEDKLGYAMLQYPGNGTMYSFETNTAADIIKLHGLVGDKSGAITISSRNIKYHPVKDKDKIFATALADARDRAQKIAKATGKQLGPLVNAVDYNSTDIDLAETVNYKPGEESYYYLSVRFLLE